MSETHHVNSEDWKITTKLQRKGLVTFLSAILTFLKIIIYTSRTIIFDEINKGFLFTEPFLIPWPRACSISRTDGHVRSFARSFVRFGRPFELQQEDVTTDEQIRIVVRLQEETYAYRPCRRRRHRRWVTVDIFSP